MSTSKPSAFKMSARARKSSCPASGSGLRLRKVISASTTGVCPLTPGSSRNCSRRPFEQIEREFRRGPEAAPLDQDRLVVKHLRRLDDLALRGEHRGVRESPFHKLE